MLKAPVINACHSGCGSGQVVQQLGSSSRWTAPKAAEQQQQHVGQLVKEWVRVQRAPGGMWHVLKFCRQGVAHVSLFVTCDATMAAITLMMKMGTKTGDGMLL
jgi:hypothetical protein